ncbi:chemotaxis protein CheA [Celerinatantimonas yamalensis]|uniref:Chemotaxis protein CheA n=1 Tax=Celerinatantimonas yamalensis TaxID=559956 RepID=A0ABW9G5T8_9GAMM
MNEAVDIFRQEAQEHLDTLESALLEIEEHPDAEQINLAFRAMHTIKGAAGMVGFDHLSLFTHHLESFFDRARNGEFELSAAMISLILECRDHIQQLLEEMEPSIELTAMSDQLSQQLNEFVPQSVAADPVVVENENVVSASRVAGKDILWRIEITPNQLAFQEGFDLLPLLRELATLGQSKVYEQLPTMTAETFDPQLCYLRVLVLLQSPANRNDIEDVFIFVADDWQIKIDEITHSRFDDVLAHIGEQGWLSAAQLSESNPDLSLAEAPSSKPLPLAETHSSKPASNPSVSSQQDVKRKLPEGQIVKVPSNKLDMLMNLIGELVIVQARLNEVARVEQNEQLDTLAEELSLLGSELRDTAFDIRMLPIGSTFARFRRLIRDLGKELNKDVQLQTEGADTELDKMVLDHLGDPLVHLLRNSMDHGIEHPEQRIAAGKAAKGTILLTASHHDGQILITISDDGAGLDAEKILNKARQRGLVGAHQELDLSEIYLLIFEPGFSTVDKVSGVSGRGVGMDVVRTSIESLQGRVEIDSQPGQGTTTTIYLPMTLAIIEGLMVRVSNERYIIPLSVVEECIETFASESSSHDGARLVKNRGELISCVRLRELFTIHGQQPVIEQTVITHVGKERLGVTVDEVIGQYQTVIKSLSRLYQKVPGLIGATILGNGDVAMILDINKLVDEARSSEPMLNMSR